MTDTYGCALTMLALMIAGVKGNENVKACLEKTGVYRIDSRLILVLAAQLGYLASLSERSRSMMPC